MNSYEKLEQCKFLYLFLRLFLEIDQELASMDLMSRAERKKEFISNKQTLVEKRQREWMLKHGKSHLLDFQDE